MSLDIPKSPIFTTRSSPTKQFLVARSLWTKWREARYTMPEAISAAMWSIWGRVNWPIRGTFISSRIRASGPWALYKNHTHYNTQYKTFFRDKSEKWKWRDMWPSMVTHTQNLCSAFNPSKVHTHSSEHTHTPWTHTRSSGSHLCCSPGSSWGWTLHYHRYLVYMQSMLYSWKKVQKEVFQWCHRRTILEENWRIFKGVVLENSVINYSPLCCSKPVRHSFIFRTQIKIIFENPRAIWPWPA